MIRVLFAIALALPLVAHAQTTPGEQQTPTNDEPQKQPEPTAEPDKKPDPDAPAVPVVVPVEEPVVVPIVPYVEEAPLTVRPIEASPDDDLTAARIHPRQHVDLGWDILYLPQKLVELAFIPIGLTVSAVDKYALDTRLFEFLSFFHGWLKIEPRLKFSFADGPGIGAWLTSAKLDSAHARVRAGGLIRLNGDWETAVEYQHALLLPGGRGIRARAFIDHDKNRRYYGIGGNTPVSDERVIRSNETGATAEVDLTGRDRLSYSGYSGVFGLGIVQQTLSSGSDSSVASLTTMDTVGLPPGFGEKATYGTAYLAARYDTRDSLGRPVRGTFAELSALARDELTGEHLSAVTFGATVSQYVPVLADHRTVVFSLSGAAATPLESGDTIPLDSLPQVSRLNDRGYDSNRFRDKYAIVGSIEYRFPVYEYLASSAGLDSFVFLDTGTLWGTTKFSDFPVHYSVGTGLRAGTQNDLSFQLTVGVSPDGFQFALGVEGL